MELKKERKDSGISNAAFLKWFNPIIVALRELGGSGKPDEVRAKIVENEHISIDELAKTRGRSKVNKFENEVAWARNYLVSAGYINNEIRGVWTLTETGKSVDMTLELASKIFKDGISQNRKDKDDAENSLGDSVDESVHYWLYAPGRNADKWERFYSEDIMAIGWGEIGDLRNFSNRNDIITKMKEIWGKGSSYINNSYATWQFANEIKVGDIVFVKQGMHKIIGRGVVKSDYYFDNSSVGGYKHVRKVEWTHKGLWEHPGQAAQKTLTDITRYTDYVKKLNALFEEDDDIDDVEEKEVLYPAYSREEFLKEVYINEQSYDTLVDLLKMKKNIVLQGAPGVGKTYAAKRLAYSIMGVKDKSRVAMVQFHQSYSYEDFIMGYRPTATGYEISEGIFYNFCKKAEIDGDNDYFFIIDEINRGNLSKIFGELFMLIENDKRGLELQLLYRNEMFSIPKNVYIIGMMNTADRSLAMIDYALRRRFAFYDLKPAFHSYGFREYRTTLNNEKFNRLIDCVIQLNTAIANDDSLGEGFCIGHSYFCNLGTIKDKTLSNIVEYEIIPLIKEYWFDEPSKVRDWSERLRSTIL
jgi:5-methylcytosine-specific restriction protein B